MSLYLHPHIQPETVKEAKKAGITGIKSYPHGVTTHSEQGVMSYEDFYPVFEEMERQGMVLNLHGEIPSSASRDITVLNAEEQFLPTLLDLHRRFPKLRIILEHCTTEAAIKAIKSCGDTVAGTITAHHLFLTVNDWAGDPHSFCKPVAKTPADRRALLETVMSGNPKFFLGTDSAPHPTEHKHAEKVAPGVFTQPHAVGLVVSALEESTELGILKVEDITPEKLENFLSTFGRAFYGVTDKKNERIVLVDGCNAIEESIVNASKTVEVYPFRRGKLIWSIEWK